MRTCERPSIVGTSTFAPSDASVTVIGTTVYKIVAAAIEKRMRLHVRDDVEIARRPAMRPGIAAPGHAHARTGLRARRDAHVQVSTRGTRPSPPQLRHIVCSRPVPPQREQVT